MSHYTEPDPLAIIGKTCSLEILGDLDIGQMLDGGAELGSILLPFRDVDPSRGVGDYVEVFVYCDSEDRLIATTEKPLVEVGQFAALRVVDTSRIGVFLDWGLPKDLLLPHKSKKGNPREGDLVVVQVLLDEKSGRLVATQKFVVRSGTPRPSYKAGDAVTGLIATEGEIGWRVVVEGTYLGMLYFNQVFCELRPGDVRACYVRKVREGDWQIDLSLSREGYRAVVPELGQTILTALESSLDGFVPFDTNSSPQAIYEAFGCSKKNFKKALGALYKKRLIQFEDGGIRLVSGKRE